MFRILKPKKNDVYLGNINIGLQEHSMSHAYYDVSWGGLIFKENENLFVGGTKEEKTFASGFYSGWKKALAEAGDNPWQSLDRLPEGPTRKVMLWADIGNGFEAMLGHWSSVQQEFTVNLTSSGLVVKYWKEIVEPE
jgi:hypothetical protein